MSAALIGAMVGGQLAGGLIGHFSSKSDRKRAAAAMAEAQAIIDAVGAPPDLSAKIIYEKFEQAGLLTPEVESAILTAESKLSQLKEDETLRDTQVSALNLLKQRARTGLGPEDRAAFNKLRQETQRDVEAKRQQILQNFAARGQAGSGQELAAALMAGQQGAELASEEGDRIAAIASERALQALMNQSNLAGSMRSADFEVNRTRAGAADEFERFNVGNQISRQQRNIDRQNIAQEQNLREKQRIQDTNTTVENQERLRQVQAKRDYWQDQLALASARAAARTGTAQQYNTQAANTANFWQGLGSSISQGVGAFANYQAAQRPQTTTGSTSNEDFMDDLYSTTRR